MPIDVESQRVLSCFEEAAREGWVSPSDLPMIRQELQAKGLSADRVGWLRHLIMQSLLRQASDEKSKRLATWADRAMRFLSVNSGAGPGTQVCFGPGDTCHQAVLNCLDRARSELLVCVFTITDDRIAEAIRRAAKRDVRVRIISDDEKAWDLGSDVHRLADQGFQVRLDSSADHMHHKFAVLDDRHVITGSFNWTKASANNFENVLICEERQVVAAYVAEFNRLWKLMRPLRPRSH